ncbi:MAG TPA: HYExAFE family protein, partial [Pirellulales bacterium]|nr:HYExAFE family protein [Pirellulales bacterium]
MGRGMANRDNHYEAAFEAFLRSRRIPYVAVDESKRSVLADASIKSLDFLVSTKAGVTWLVDVKGRNFPGGAQKQYWKNWSTRDDLVSMAQWQRLFGERFEALFVFAYRVLGDRSPLPREELFEHR